MDIENIESLAEGLNKWMKELSKTTSLDPVKQVDVLLTENDITIENIRDMNRLRPFYIFLDLFLKWMIYQFLQLRR